MAAEYNFDFKKVAVFLGPFQIVGFMDGTGIKVTRDEDAYSKKVGADGEVARAKSNNRAGSCVLSVMQTSPSNDVLSGLANTDEASDDGILPLLVKELGSGRTLCFAPHAWVKKFSELGYGKEIEGREWTLDTGAFNEFIGGNVPLV